MDKSIQISSFVKHSPRFKPWAMEMHRITQNRFNGLKKCMGLKTNKLSENQIDQLVYQLYELTEEEIKIIENA
jgi:hypothetical protein